MFYKDFRNIFDYFIPISKLKRKIKELNFNRYGNNEVYLIKDGKRRRVNFNGIIPGLEIVFNGKNNLVEIEEPFFFQDVRIIIKGENNLFSIKKNSFISTAYMNIFHGAQLKIGENFRSIHDGRFFAGGFASLSIGNNCLFSRRLCIYTGDGHTLIDNQSQKPLNIIYKPVEIGNNVWIGDDVMILKNVTIPNGTIIGAKSLVNNAFEEENTLIAGNPAEIKKHNVSWSE